MMADTIADSDLVITTAAIPGRPSPKLIAAAVVGRMRPRSVIVDLASERGGNCELTKPGETYTTDGGVTIIGQTNVAIIEVDGNHQDTLMGEMEAIAALLTGYDCGDVFFADDAQQKAELWKLRRRVAEAVKIDGYTIEEDTVVPRAELPALIRGVKALGKQYDFDVVCYGHAGDGNLHIRIKKPGSRYSLNNPDVIPALKALFKLVHSLGGTISGEHGIGLVQKEYMDIVFDEAGMQLMRGIKKVFDPNGILNRGKIFDS
jgi:glycolate oxidase